MSGIPHTTWRTNLNEDTYYQLRVMELPLVEITKMIHPSLKKDLTCRSDTVYRGSLTFTNFESEKYLGKPNICLSLLTKLRASEKFTTC